MQKVFFNQEKTSIRNIYAGKGLFQTGNHQYVRHAIKYNKTKFCQCLVLHTVQNLCCIF